MENAPELNLELYTQHPEAQTILQNTLGNEQTNWSLQFETDIIRTLRVFNYQDAEIEVSLDIGCIRTTSRTGSP